MSEATSAASGSRSESRGGSPRRPRDVRLLAGLAIVLGAGCVALLAPWLAPYDPRAYPAIPNAGPSLGHLLGANDAGQDLFSELLYGTRVSLLVGLLVGVISTVLAWGLGLLSGLSRRADAVVGELVDLVLLLPPLPVVILATSYLGQRLPVILAALSLVSWGAFARIVRGQVQSELRKPHSEAAQSLGASAWRIVLRHVAPATVPLAAVKFVTTVQFAVVVQASLAFLGLADPTTISWGQMAYRAAHSPLIFLSRAWLWWLLPPSLAIAILVVGLACIGWSIEERRQPALSRRT